MATTALGIMQDADGAGVDAPTHRKIIQSHWLNTGVVTGLAVTGTGLAYSVAAGVAVVSRGGSDGYAEAYWPGGSTDAVSANSGGSPRIDRVWIKANDAQQGDADNRVHVGVTKGTPAASPTPPALPSGCTLLMDMLVPAGAANVNSAQPNDSVTYAIPYGASLGVLARVEEAVNGAVPNDRQTPFLQARVYLPTDRNVTVTAFLCVSTPEKDGQSGVATCRFMVDGERYTTRKIEYSQNWVTYEPSTDVQLDAGYHTIGLVMFNQTGPGYVAHYGEGSGFDAGDNYVGRVLRVNDNGPAR